MSYFKIVSNFLHSAKWSFLGSILPKIIQPFLFIYIARLLLPEDYGLVAIANIVISFVQLFLGQGFNQALIREQKNVEKAANFVFTYNLIFSGVFYLFIFFASSSISVFFNEPEARSVIVVMALSLIIRAFGSVQTAILQKEMDFKSIFYRQISPTFVMLCVTLPMAWKGFGVWALIAGSLVSDVVGSWIMWRNSSWKPKFSLQIKEYVHILNFGVLVILEGMLSWAYSQYDNLIVGKYLSTANLGVYRLGFNFITMIVGLFLTPLNPVLYAKLCTISDQNSIKAYYLKIKKISSYIIFPIVFGLILTAYHIEKIFYGEKWENLGWVIMILAINPGLSYLWAFTSEFYKALGRVQIINRILFLTLLYVIPSYFIGVQYGLKIFCLFRMSVFFIGGSIHHYYESRIIYQKFLPLISYYIKPFIFSLTFLIIGYIIQISIFKSEYSVLSLISLVIVSVIIYLLEVFIWDRETWKEILILLRNS